MHPQNIEGVSDSHMQMQVFALNPLITRIACTKQQRHATHPQGILQWHHLTAGQGLLQPRFQHRMF